MIAKLVCFGIGVLGFGFAGLVLFIGCFLDAFFTPPPVHECPVERPQRIGEEAV